MEQRIGPVIPPVHAAGTDPAYIPGLTPPPRAAEPAQEPPGGTPPEAPEEAAPAKGPAGLAPVAEEEEPETEPESESEDDGAEPDFEISDARGSITASRRGIRFRLDGETAEFGWGEIGAVEITTPRLARRFTVTVHTIGRRTYEADVDAPSRGLPRQWAAEFEAVLDDYFDDGAAADA